MRLILLILVLIAASVCLDRAVAEDPDAANLRVSRGNEWLARKEYDKAIADFTEALRLEPENAVAFNNRGNAWQNKKEYDKAIADFTEALRFDPKNARVHYNRGNAQWCKKKYDEAIADYTESLRLDPDFAPAYVNRGDARSRKKDYVEALSDHKEALRLDPKNAYAHGGLANTHAKIRKYDAAIASFEKAEELDSMDWLHRDFARFRASCPDAKYRDGAKAVALAKKGIEKAGKDVDWEYHDVLAMAHAEANDFELAVSEQRKALELLAADKGGNADDRKRAEARLALYRNKKAYRDEE